MTAPGCGHTPIACQQRYIEHGREGDVNRVIRRQIASQLPDARQKDVMSIPAQRKVGEIQERLTTAFRVDFPSGSIPADGLCHFNVEQMRRMHCLRAE